MKTKKILKIILGIIIFITFIIIVIKVFPLMQKLSNKEGLLNFKEEIQSLGFKGFFLLFGMQLLQILLVILPGEPLEVLAGMCYGGFGGAFFITVSVFITTTLIFFIIQKLGRKYLYNFFSKNQIDKFENNILLKNSKTVEITLAILFLLPGTPKDFIVYIGALLPIKPLRFILISTFVRLPSVITSTLVGANISLGNLKTSFIIYAITFVITVIIIYYINKKDKNKELSKILK